WEPCRTVWRQPVENILLERGVGGQRVADDLFGPGGVPIHVLRVRDLEVVAKPVYGDRGRGGGPQPHGPGGRRDQGVLGTRDALGLLLGVAALVGGERRGRRCGCQDERDRQAGQQVPRPTRQ